MSLKSHSASELIIPTSVDLNEINLNQGMTKIEIEDEKYVGIKIEHIYRPTCRDNKIQKQKQMQNARQDFGIMLGDC